MYRMFEIKYPSDCSIWTGDVMDEKKYSDQLDWVSEMVVILLHLYV